MSSSGGKTLPLVGGGSQGERQRAGGGWQPAADTDQKSDWQRAGKQQTEISGKRWAGWSTRQSASSHQRSALSDQPRLAPRIACRHCAAMGIEVLGDPLPIERGDPLFKAGHSRVGEAALEGTDQIAPSRWSNARFRSTPHRYPDSAPLLRTTRWQGMTTAIAFAAHAPATPRTAFGAPIRSAISV